MRSRETRAATAALAAAVASLAIVAVMTGPAHGQPGGARQLADVRYTTTQPGAPSGFTWAIDFRDPANPGGKPYSVARVSVRDHPGFVIDASVVPHCKASDAELYAQGAAACPPDTRVAGGRIVSDTGGENPPFPRIIENKVDNFANADEVVGVADSTNAPLVPGVTRVVTRSQVRGNPPTTTFDVPGPFPGTPPPDNYSALKSIRLSASPVVRAGRALGRTPPSCPAAGYWTIALTFTYHDGVTQQADSRSPCSPAGAVARDGRAPRISLGGVRRRRCNRPRIRARVKVTDRERSLVRRTAVYVDGRLVHNVIGRRSSQSSVRFVKRIRIATRRAGRHRLTVKARDASANRSKRTLRFRTCRR